MEREPPHPSDDDERLRLLDTMATMADRATRPDTFRFHIEQVRDILHQRLLHASPPLFDFILNALLRCGTTLPFKAPMYATLAGLLTSASHPFCKPFANALADAVVSSLSSSLRDGLQAPARRALRFLICLSSASLVSPTSVADYVHTLLDAAHFELTSANRSEFSVHGRADFLAEIALSALPWASSLFLDRAPSQMSAITALVDQIAADWTPNMWRCVAPSLDRRCNEAFTHLLDAVSYLRDNQWRSDTPVIQSPYSAFEIELGSGQEIKLPPLVIPAHSKVTSYSAPRFHLLFVNPRQDRPVDRTLSNPVSDPNHPNPDPAQQPTVKSELTTVPTPSTPEPASATQTPAASDLMDASANPAPSSIDVKHIRDTNGDSQNQSPPSNGPSKSQTSDPNSDSPPQRTPMTTYVIRCYVHDVVDNFYSRHIMAAERLLNLPMLKDVNDEIVECLFSQMCALPFPSSIPVYYGTLFADLCRVKDSRLPAKLLIAVKTMFQHADEFDPEAFDRLTDWFSFHLSNFGYKWNWQDWAVYADQDMVEKFPYRALFCKDVIARCVRLSYFDRMATILPDEMKVFLPPKPNAGNQSRFQHQVNDELMKIVTGKGRLPWTEVRRRLAELIPAEDNGDGADDGYDQVDSTLARLSALLRAILKAGCRTLSHFDIVVERYMDLLREMSNKGGQPARRLISAEVTVFWSDVHIRRMYVLDKLAQYGVIDHMSILDSCLSFEKPCEGTAVVELSNAELKVRLAQSPVWEIIRLVMSRARAREDGSRRELALASQSAATANEGEQEEAEERLEKAKSGTEEAKRESRNLLMEGLRRLFEMVGRLLDDSDAEMEEEGAGAGGIDRGEGERLRLPGVSGAPIWYWRCLGMMRELARMHPQHLQFVVPELDEYSRELREKHRVLWEAFEIIREVEKCSLHITVC